ncbi:hypothetical protein BU197_28550 [Streptomyces sp. CBMA291]|nr:hypothetical protein [Streptomyces sp. CBMA291]MBD0715248.1 hypothetical protein [Streptomyces sp. CBMA370]
MPGLREPGADDGPVVLRQLRGVPALGHPGGCGDLRRPSDARSGFGARAFVHAVFVGAVVRFGCGGRFDVRSGFGGGVRVRLGVGRHVRAVVRVHARGRDLVGRCHVGCGLRDCTGGRRGVGSGRPGRGRCDERGYGRPGRKRRGAGGRCGVRRFGGRHVRFCHRLR